MVHVADMTITKGADVDVVNGTEKLILEGSRDIFKLLPLSRVFGVTVDDGTYVGGIGAGSDTIPTRNGRELGEIWVSKVGTNF